MKLSLVLAALLVVPAVPVRAQQVADTTAEATDTMADTSRRQSRRAPPRRDSVTTEHLATAFRSRSAQELLLRARTARLTQDSTLRAYDARANRRISARLGFRRIGRERLAFRHETAGRVRWNAERGAWVDLTGSRTVIPMVPRDRGRVQIVSGDIVPIPHYPGRESLWIGGQGLREEVDEQEMVHPLARGSEAYYRYAHGDSAIFTLPNGDRIRIQELRVEARRPQWNLIVGSFWFDTRNAQLVRAAYRPSIPLDIVMIAEQDGDDDIPRWLRPMTATVHAITIEYGLHRSEEGRAYWLPRAQSATGEAQVSFMRVPFSMEESFRYASVNSADPFPELPVRASADTAQADTTAADTTTRRRRRAGSVIVHGDSTYRVSTREHSALRVYTQAPRDSMLLASSPDLPPSPYESGEELFSTADREALMSELGFGLQAGWAPQPPNLYYGLERGMVRYNRIEGLSVGAGAEMQLGRGMTLDGNLRLGVADLEPNAELYLSRSDGRRTLELGVYRRLVSSGDWETPFTFGHSLNALLFGRDDAFYHRALGAELRGLWRAGSPLTWRLFVERHTPAEVETHFSLPNVLGDHEFLGNIDAERGTMVGIGSRYLGSFGLNPRGLRTTIDVRGETGFADFEYARVATDLTFSHPVTRRVDGAITLGAGSSVGELPVQRMWYLGGVHTVRGQPIGTMAGDAYWLTRLELGSSFVLARPVIFGDLGWAGAREDFTSPGVPMSGAGVGVSFLDGLVRFDLSKGLRPNRRVRADLYLEARF